MILYRKSIKLNLGFSEDDDARFVNELFTSWKEIKDFIANILDKIMESWEKDDTKEVHQAYFG